MPDLRLGRLPKVGVVRMTIILPEPLKENSISMRPSTAGSTNPWTPQP
jgi:hypothetical protein